MIEATETVVATEPKMRSMNPEDRAAVIQINREITGQEGAISYADMRDVGGPLDLSIVAEVGEDIAGFILARHAFIGEPAQAVGLIQLVGVDPDYQYKGIAHKLVAALTETCRLRGIRVIQIMVNENEGELAEFFACAGFHRGQLVDYERNV